MSTWEEELNADLNDVQKHKPPISASRVSSVTKLAYKHSKHANDIAFMIENFLELAKPEYKLAALYLIDSICKAKKQSDRDVYVKRFSQNIENTINRVLDCTEKDKAAVKKVINLWVSQKVFNENILQTVAQVMQQRIGVVPDGITIKPVQPTVGFDAQALLATIASQTPTQPAVNYNYNSAAGATMPMNTMPGQVPVGMTAPITNYANPAQFTYVAPTVTSTPIVPVATIQPRPAAQPLDSALFDIYDDLEDDEQRIAEQKKRREEEEQKRREEQDRLLTLANNQAAPVAEQPVAVQTTQAQIAPTPASVPPPQVQVPVPTMNPNMHMQQPTGAMNAMPGAPFNQQPAPIQSQGLPPPPNTYQPMAVPHQQPNMGRGGGYVPPMQPNPYGQFQPNPAASGNFQQQGMQQGFPGGPNQFNTGPPQFNGQVPPNMQGKGPMGRGRGRGFNNYAPDPANLPTGEPVGNNMVRNKSKILFVGNLAPTVTEEHLGKIYSKYTGEAKVRYLAPKHMAFVAFPERSIAEKAKEETVGKFLEGRDLKVGWAMEFKSDDFNRDTGEATVPMNAISMYRADQFVVLPHNPNDVIPLEEPRGRGRGGFGRGGGDFNGMGRGRGGFGRGRGLQSYDDNSHYGGGHRNFQSQWSHPQQSGGDDGSDYSVKLTGGEEDKGAAKSAQGAGYGQYDNYYDSYYYGTGDQAEYYQQYYAAAGADPYGAAAAKSGASSDDKNTGGSGPSSRKRSRSRSRSRDRRRSRSRSRSRDRRSGGRRRSSRSKSRSRSRSRDRDSKRRKL